MSKKKTEKKNTIELDVKTHIVDLDGIKFHIRPQEYIDVADTWNWMDEAGFTAESDNPVHSVSVEGYAFIRRVEKWEGIVFNGKKAICNMENKAILFGRMPQLLFDLQKKYYEMIEADSKN